MSKVLGIFIILFLAFGFSKSFADLSNFARVQTMDCVQILEHIEDHIGGLEMNIDPLRKDLGPTIRHVKWLPGRHGGRLELIERVGPSWSSIYFKTLNDPQGNPQWLIRMLGVKAASFLGFKVYQDDHFMTVPDAAELNGAIAKLNIRLSGIDSTYLIRDWFYEQKGQELNDFLIKSVEGGSPIAIEYPSRSHDLSTHTEVIFLPEPVKTHGDNLTTAVLDLTNYVETHLRGTIYEKPALEWSKLMKFIRAKQRDAGTALFFEFHSFLEAPENYYFLTLGILNYMGYNKDSRNMDEEAIERIRGVFSKLSNKYSLEEMIGASTGKNNIGNRFFPQNMKDRLVTIGKLGKVKAFIELQKEWEEQYIKLHPNFYIQNLPKLMELTRQLQYKRFLIIKVASELEDENIP